MSQTSGAVVSHDLAHPLAREGAGATSKLGNVTAATRFRQKRFLAFEQLAAAVRPAGRPLRIVDIGGTHSYWLQYGSRLLETEVDITVVNLSPQITGDGAGKIRTVVGDGRRLEALTDDAFDIVHSNSVIEHVGDWRDMVDAAREIRRLAPAYFVQTPYFWFPFEPHAKSWFLHWWPEQVRYRKLMRRRHGHWGPIPSVSAAVERVQSARLLDRGQMQALFPDAQLLFERVYGMPKSIMAIRRGRGANSAR
jgi:hypothetical protein